MALLARSFVAWTGINGLPGVSVFYSPAASVTFNTNITAFFNSIKALFVNGLSWQIPNNGDVILDTDGSLQGVWSQAGGGTVVAGGSVGAYAAGVGCRVRWNTAGIVHKRRVRGETFLAPMTGAQLDTNGTIVNAAVTTIQTAATTLASTGDLVIWSRPFAGAPNNPARAGSSFAVTSATVPDIVTSLRSRRT